MPDYNPKSLDAVLARLESKLDAVLERQDKQDHQNGKLWAALAQVKLSVVAIAAGISVVAWIVERVFWK